MFFFQSSPSTALAWFCDTALAQHHCLYLGCARIMPSRRIKVHYQSGQAKPQAESPVLRDINRRSTNFAQWIPPLANEDVLGKPVVNANAHDPNTNASEVIHRIMPIKKGSIDQGCAAGWSPCTLVCSRSTASVGGMLQNIETPPFWGGLFSPWLHQNTKPRAPAP